MKFWFFIAILANLVLFLWEVQNGALDKIPGQPTPSAQNEKQILLVNELAVNQQKSPKIMAVAKNEAVTADILDKTKDIVLEDMEIKEQQVNDGVPQKPNSVINSDVLPTTMLETEDLGKKNITEVSKEKPDIKVIESEALLIAEQKTKNANDNLINAEAVEKVMACYEIGPFMDEKDVFEWLKNNDIDVIDKFETFNKGQQKLSSYLVYYPAAETYAESRKNQQMLREKGITDLWLFRKGDMKGAISLGLFKKKKRAEKLVDYLSSNGIQVKIIERFINEKSQFVRVNMPGNPNKLPQPLTARRCAR